MAAVRRRNLVSSRRRIQDEGEDDDAGAVDLGDESLSETSLLGVGDANLDADDSDSDLDTNHVTQPSASKAEVTRTTKSSRRRKIAAVKTDPPKQLPQAPPVAQAFFHTTDTDAMLNGLKVPTDATLGEAIDFEDTLSAIEIQIPTQRTVSEVSKLGASGRRQSVAEQRSKEHEEHKAKRESNPASVPNRGGFFMHDHRHDPHGFGSVGKGRGRGRGMMANTYTSPGLASHQVEANNSRWNHDLHDTVTGPKPTTQEGNGWNNHLLLDSQPHISSHVPKSLSKSVSIGTLTTRVFLPDMNKPINFEKMPVRQHTRLPDLRPPLRRDKPVRVSVPDQAPRYIFPSTERSFIFIPRAQRPNQQGGRSRARAYFSQNGSRRGSVHGGSIYSPSFTVSRRSSMARDGFTSPTGSTISRVPFGAPTGPSRPVVKLPTGSHHDSVIVLQLGSNSTPGVPTPTVSIPTYPLPSRPAYRETRPSYMPMHQPRPQKTVSLATIESPALAPIHAPQQQELQPFHQQVPAHINGQSIVHDQSNIYNPTQQMPFNGQIPGVTPLPNIQERAMNAQPFQPTTLQHAFFQPGYSDLNMYYSPPTDGQQDPYSTNAMAPPMYMSQVPQGGYYVPMLLPAPPSPDQPSTLPQAGTMSYEHNGMVYFYDPSQVPNTNIEVFVPTDYTIPSGSSMMLPAPPSSTPNGIYYTPSAMVFYPQQHS